MRAHRAAAAAIALAIGTALTACAAPAADPPADPVADPETGLVHIGGEVALTCGGGSPANAFPASALEGGIEPADPSGIAAALDALAAEAGIDAPPALQGTTAAEAPWIVLRETTQEALVAVGDWGPQGPGSPEDMTVSLERDGETWDAVAWGNCWLTPALAQEHTFWTALGAPDVADSDTELTLQVMERSCTGGREPDEFLREPVVVETAEDVTVYWTSGYYVGDPPADADQMGWACPGNPFVERTVSLEAPLGERPVLDGSTWPARDVRGQTVDPVQF